MSPHALPGQAPPPPPARPLTPSILPDSPADGVFGPLPQVPSSPPPAPAMREFGDTLQTRANIYAGTLAAAQALPPVEDDKYSLRLADVDWHDPERFTRKQRKEAVLTGGTLARRMKGTWQLYDKATGDLMSERRQVVAAVPYLSSLGTFTHNGSEYTVNHQQRLKSGVFARLKDNGETESHFNVLPGKGVSHRYFLDPENGVFKMKIGQGETPVMPLMKAMGATDQELQDAWGRDVWQANAAKNDTGTLKKLAQKLLRKKDLADADEGSVTNRLVERFNAMELDPSVTARTLGHPYDRVSKEAILAATSKLLKISRKEAEPDDRDHLAYQQFLGPEDLFAERLRRDHGGVRRNLMRKISFAGGDLSKMPSGALTPQLEQVLLGSGLGQSIEEINPMEVFDKQTRITRMGEGGISSIDAIPQEARAVQPSHMGFIDPIRSPESLRVGVDLNMARASRKGQDGKIYTQVHDKAGQAVWKTPEDLADAAIATPEVAKWDTALVPVMKAGKIDYIPKGQIDYTLPDFSSAFSPLSNLVPFMSATKPGRVSMGARYITQALPLVNAEAPFVRGGIPDQPGRSYEEDYGKHVGAVHAKQGGRVTKIEDGTIHLKYDDGTPGEVELYNNHPFNRKTFFHQTSTVEPGATFTPGQLLARSNYTDHTGAAALGMNLKTAYMAYKGSITPDTHVLWYLRGRPRYTPVSEVRPQPTLSALALRPHELTMTVQTAHGFISHIAEKTVTVVTSSGRRVGATLNHSFVVLGASGDLVEIKTDQLTKNSWLPRLGAVELPITSRAVVMRSPRKSQRVILDEDFGFIVGLYVAEGCRQKTGVAFAATDIGTRTALLAAVQKALPDVGVSTGQRNYVIVGCSPLRAWLVRHCGHLAHNKKMPNVVFGAPVSFRRGVLAGFWTGDGRVHDKNGTPTDTDTIITSRRLRDGLGLLCASLGISTTHSEYDDPKCTYGKTYRLGISCRDAHKLPPLRHSNKGERLANVVASYRDTGLAERVPLFVDAVGPYRLLSRGKVRNIAERIRRQATAGVAARRDVLAVVPSNTPDPALKRLRQLALSSVEWDRVEEVRPSDYTGLVYDFDMAPLCTFVCVDTLVVHNSNFEDASVISESAAKKLTSEHMYQHDLEVTDKHKMGKDAYISFFPGKYDKKTLEKLDRTGVVQVGQTVEFGDPLILAAKERDRADNKIHKKRQPGYSDDTVTWKHHDPGVVTDVVWGKSGPVAVVKATSQTQVGDKLCFDSDTKMLTRDRGWVPVADVKRGDEVFTLNPTTGFGEWQKVTHTWAYDHEGDMAKIVTKHVDMLVTLDHRVWAARNDGEFTGVPASQIIAGGSWRFKKNCQWAGREVPIVRFNPYSVQRVQSLTEAVTDDWLEFLGYYVAEGWCSLREGGGKYVKIGQYRKSPHWSKIDAVIKRLGLHFNYNAVDGRFEVGNAWLYSELVAIGDSYTKRVPAWIQDLCPRQLAIFFAAYMAGDGHKGAAWEYSTSSEKLMYDLQLVCIKLGWSVTVREVTRSDNWAKERHWRGRVNRKHLTPGIKPSQVAAYAGNVVKVVPYSGKVYCVTVSNHIIYVSRNGKTYWSHNSGRFGDKGVISAIVPDDQMPHDKDGNPFEILLSPDGTISRANPSQMLESALGKIAAKTGKPVTVPDFQGVDDLTGWAEKELAKHGLKSTEDVTWPEKGTRVKDVGTGYRFMMKLHHMAEGKAQGRDSGSYSADESPAKGGETGCFTGDTLVACVTGFDPYAVTATGRVTLVPIRDLVRDRRPCYVASTTKPGDPSVEQVTDWFEYMVPTSEMVTLTLGNGQTVHCTVSHEFVLKSGTRKRAGDLTPADELMDAA